MPRPKYLFFTAIAAMMLVVLQRDLSVMFGRSDPALAEHFRRLLHMRPVPWWLTPHALAGVLALLLAPSQFSTRIRQRHLRWHRNIGRAYVYSVLVAAPLGVYVEYLKWVNGIGSLRLVIATIGFATLWLVTTGTGFHMARLRNIVAHKRWMTRSYAVALVFLEVRTVDQSAFLTKLTAWPSELLESHSISDLWMYVLFAPIAAQLVLECERLVKKRSSRRMAQAATTS
jgi:uncharacterized membrane protein